MRKQTKLAVGLSAAALLVIGASMTSFASGWVQEGDDWYYADNNGDYVTDKWKNYNGSYFYLGDDGAMLTNQLVEDGDNYYYVDANGAMVKNTWVAIAADEDEEQDVDYRWYYFGSSGKAYTNAKKKTINGKSYGFDDDGKMLFGFVDEDGSILDSDEEDPVLKCTYYYGSNDDGAMRKSEWLRYEDGFNTDDYEDKDYAYYWFYFGSDGTKTVGSDDGQVKVKKISGQKYAFDENGVMLLEWAMTSTKTDAASTTTYKYFSDNLEDGSLKKNTWIYAEASGDMLLATDDVDDTDPHWYRTDNQGVVVTGHAKKVDSKWYVFNDLGVMQAGLVVLDTVKISSDSTLVYNDLTPKQNSKGLDGKIDQDSKTAEDIYNGLGSGEYLYYFSDSESSDGSMKTGSSITLSLADDDYTFAFNKTSGNAYAGIVSKKAYLAGIRQSAGSDKYAVVQAGHSLADGVNGTGYFLVNSSGTIVTTQNKYYKDADDNCYVVIGTVELEGDKEADVKGDVSYKIVMFDDVDDAKAYIAGGDDAPEPTQTWGE